MTATVAKKATAAELRANFAHYYCSVHASHGCTQPCDWLAELDVLLAAARAEAVADAGDDAVELREALLSLSARPDDPNRPHINDIIGACIRAARAEAVAPLEARVAELESERGALVEADILRRARVGKGVQRAGRTRRLAPGAQDQPHRTRRAGHGDGQGRVTSMGDYDMSVCEHGRNIDSAGCDICFPPRCARPASYCASRLAAAEARAEKAEGEVDCGQDDVCAKAPGCQRHWAERNRELTSELAEARRQLGEAVEVQEDLAGKLYGAGEAK